MAARVVSVCGCGRTFASTATHVRHAARCPDANRRPEWASPAVVAYENELLDRARADERRAS
jgi:hypothetical protein